MAKAGSETGKGESQEYQYCMPFISASGHEISFYDTPDAQRLLVKHTSGSHIEFKTDGSIFIKAVKDLHVHGSCLSEQQSGSGGGAGAQAGDASNLRFDADLNIEVAGTLRVTARKLELDIKETTNAVSGTDMTFTANNLTEKAFENISIEGTKSVYVDTKEYRERSVSHRVEEGTMEDTIAGGGLNYMNVKGHFVINNTDPNGSISLMTKGYLNLICGQERLDMVGQYLEAPDVMRMGTFTQYIKKPLIPSLFNRSKKPGDHVVFQDAGYGRLLGVTTAGSSINPLAAISNMAMRGEESRILMKGKRNTLLMKGDDILTLMKGNYVRTIMKGNETDTILKGNKLVTIGKGNLTSTIGGNEVKTVAQNSVETAAGILKKTASMVFLN